MSDERASMSLPSDFDMIDEVPPANEKLPNSLKLSSTRLPPKTGSSLQVIDKEHLISELNTAPNSKVGNNMEELDDMDEKRSQASSSYYSVASRESSRTFLTTRSRYSRVSHVDTSRTPWQQTLHEKKLIPSKFDETNWSDRGQHVEFNSDESSLIDSLLVPNGVLGHSATAVVEKVRCKRIVLARKKIRCNWRLKREDAIEEVAHLQRLSHAHVIRVVGTYVVGKELSILLYPATEHNLESFLDEYAELSPGNTLMPRKNQARFWMEEGMSQFPTCLVHAIHFVHGQLVKHMDVKPTNLLVQRKVRALETSYKIYLADFGIARSYNTAADAETESRTPFSRTYAAPEVIRQDKRGFSADIFSLGCVLLEIYAAWVGRRAEFNDLRRQNSDGDVSYQANMEGLEGYIHSVRGRGQIEIPQSFIHGNRYSVWTMMHHDPHCRPTAEELVQAHDIFRPASCCTAGPEPFRAENSLKNNR